MASAHATSSASVDEVPWFTLHCPHWDGQDDWSAVPIHPQQDPEHLISLPLTLPLDFSPEYFRLGPSTVRDVFPLSSLLTCLTSSLPIVVLSQPLIRSVTAFLISLFLSKPDSSPNNTARGSTQQTDDGAWRSSAGITVTNTPDQRNVPTLISIFQWQGWWGKRQ
jgi:hypothetical protein